MIVRQHDCFIKWHSFIEIEWPMSYEVEDREYFLEISSKNDKRWYKDVQQQQQQKNQNNNKQTKRLKPLEHPRTPVTLLIRKCIWVFIMVAPSDTCICLHEYHFSCVVVRNNRSSCPIYGHNYGWKQFMQATPGVGGTECRAMLATGCINDEMETWSRSQ